MTENAGHEIARQKGQCHTNAEHEMADQIAGHESAAVRDMQSAEHENAGHESKRFQQCRIHR